MRRGVHEGNDDAAICEAASRPPLYSRLESNSQGKKRGRACNAPKFGQRTRLFQICGVGLTRIDGVDEMTALAVVSEVGADMAMFQTFKHLASWLSLCRRTKITGGKEMRSKTKRAVNRAAHALRLAAAALRSSNSR